MREYEFPSILVKNLTRFKRFESARERTRVVESARESTRAHESRRERTRVTKSAREFRSNDRESLNSHQLTRTVALDWSGLNSGSSDHFGLRYLIGVFYR